VPKKTNLINKATTTMSEQFKLETVEPKFFNGHLNVPVLRRIDGHGTRFYYDYDHASDSVIYYPSLTSVLAATLPTPYGLLKWYADNGMEGATRLRDEAAAYGTFLHIIIANCLINRTFNLDTIHEEIAVYKASENLRFDTSDWAETARKDVLSFAAFANEKNLEVIAIEIALCSKEHGYAGAIDIVGMMDFNKKRVRAIIDNKSGKKGFYPSHEVQLDGYAGLWNENFPDQPIEMIFNWAPKDWTASPTYELKNQTGSSLRGILPHLLNIYSVMGAAKPSDKIICAGQIELGKDLSSAFAKRSIDDIIREKHQAQTENLMADAASF
jgi:hypothetical protein